MNVCTADPASRPPAQGAHELLPPSSACTGHQACRRRDCPEGSAARSLRCPERVDCHPGAVSCVRASKSRWASEKSARRGRAARAALRGALVARQLASEHVVGCQGGAGACGAMQAGASEGKERKRRGRDEATTLEHVSCSSLSCQRLQPARENALARWTSQRTPKEATSRGALRIISSSRLFPSNCSLRSVQRCF